MFLTMWLNTLMMFSKTIQYGLTIHYGLKSHNLLQNGFKIYKLYEQKELWVS